MPGTDSAASPPKRDAPATDSSREQGKEPAKKEEKEPAKKEEKKPAKKEEKEPSDGPAKASEGGQQSKRDVLLTKEPDVEAAKEKYDAARGATRGYFAAAMVLAFLLGVAGFYWTNHVLEASAVAAALGAFTLFVAAYYVPQDRTNVNRSGERLALFLRDDKQYLSLARLQFFIWTAIVIFAFAWITFIRVFSGAPPFTGASEITPNLLAVMGISTGSTVTSAAIEAQRRDSGTGEKNNWGDMLCEITKDGNLRPSLGKFQMLAWTVISVGIYAYILLLAVYQVWAHGGAGALTLPDLDPTLVVLMGISHVGYNGSKYVSVRPSA